LASRGPAVQLRPGPTSVSDLCQSVPRRPAGNRLPLMLKVAFALRRTRGVRSASTAPRQLAARAACRTQLPPARAYGTVSWAAPVGDVARRPGHHRHHRRRPRMLRRRRARSMTWHNDITLERPPAARPRRSPRGPSRDRPVDRDIIDRHQLRIAIITWIQRTYDRRPGSPDSAG